MKKSYKQKIALFLLLIFSIGIAPSALAVNFDINASVTSHHASLMQGSKFGSEDCPVKYCQNFSDCAVHYNCTPLPSASLILMPVLVLIQLKGQAGNIPILTRNPRPLERPPRLL
jgi:hypothetical protein